MAKIAYVDHSYHKKTLSNKFLPDILRRHGHAVDLFWDEAWNGGKAIPFNRVADYDVIIMFQCRCSSNEKYFKKLHKNVIYIPMLDSLGIAKGPIFNLASHWKPYQGCKVISFSSAVHSIVTAFGLYSLYIRYYQEPIDCLLPADGMRGFFWLRHEDQVSWPMIRALLGENIFKSLHIHIAADPGSPSLSLPSKQEIQKYNITTSTWFENKKDMLDILERSNIYFAPRLEEGIGQSFLEAMSRGQCVVAPDNGTMNEYIIHGLNGLLYSHRNVAPLDFSRWEELGKAARKTVECGVARWHEQEQRLVDFILTPADKLYKGLYHHIPHLKLLKKLLKKIRRNPLLRKTERYWLPLWKKLKSCL